MGDFSVVGTHIRNPDGSTFHGRGANLLDTRFCGVCGAPSATSTEATRTAEVIRRLDDLVDHWKANFIRLDLETLSPSAGSGAIASDSFVSNAAYLQAIKEVVDHAATKPNLLLMLSIWDNGSLDSNGWPTNATNQELSVLATTFKNHAHVMFGVSNEPQNNFSGSQNAQAWARMNSAVQAIRDAETAAGATVKHLVAVQGLGGWARQLDYYITHPITADNGVNVVYEIHVYDPVSSFAAMYEAPSTHIPIIIGEFGPANGSMTAADCTALMDSAQAREIPYLAWQYGMNCPPDLVQNTLSQATCGVGTTLTPSTWGTQFKARLAIPW